MGFGKTFQSYLLFAAVASATALTAARAENDPQGFSYALDMYREYQLPLANCQPRQDVTVSGCVAESEYQSGLTMRQFICIRNSGLRKGATGTCANAVRKMEREFGAHVRGHRETLFRIFQNPKNRRDYANHCAVLRDVAKCPGLENASGEGEHFRNFSCLWRQVNLQGEGLTTKEEPGKSLANTVERSQLKNSQCGRFLNAMRSASARAGGPADHPIAFTSQAVGRSGAPELGTEGVERAVASEEPPRREARAPIPRDTAR